MNDERLEQLLAEREWMRGLALHLARSSDAARDLGQDTWVRLLRHPPAGGRPVRAWIYTVMANLARDNHRRRQRRHVREEKWARSQDGQTADDDPLEVDEAITRLRAALVRLSEAQREVIYLRFFCDLQPSEVARQSGVPAATVRTRLKRALDVLRGELDAYYGDDRSRWSALLLPWAARDVWRRPTTPVGDTSLPGLVGGSIGLVVTVTLIASWLLHDSNRTTPPDFVATIAGAAPAATGYVPIAPRHDAARLVPSPMDLPTAVPATGTAREAGPSATIHVHDADTGAPLDGVTIIATPRKQGGPGELQRTVATEASTPVVIPLAELESSMDPLRGET